MASDGKTATELVRELLESGPKRVSYLAEMLWDPRESSAWIVRPAGGPPAWAMPMGRILKRLNVVTVEGTGIHRIVRLP